MRFLMRMAVVLALVFAVSGVMANAAETTANKAPAKKAVKKDAKKKAVKKEVKKKKEAKKKVVKNVPAGASEVLAGANVWGRPGLIYGDTAEVNAVGKVQGSANFLYMPVMTGVSAIVLPFGINVSPVENLSVLLGGTYSAVNFSSDFAFGEQPGQTEFSVNGGLKYSVKADDGEAIFSIGEDVGVNVNGHGSVFATRGVLSHTLDGKLLLSASVAMDIHSLPGAGTEGGIPSPYMECNGGMAYAFSPNFAGIVEIGANQMGYNASVFSGGFRAGASNFMVQGTVGLNMSNNMFIGGVGVGLATE